MEITRYGSLMGVSFAGRTSYSSKYEIRSQSGVQKYSKSTIPDCERVSRGDTIKWTDTMQNYDLSLYLCFSNSSCPANPAETVHYPADNFWSSWWFYPVIGIFVVSCVA